MRLCTPGVFFCAKIPVWRAGCDPEPPFAPEFRQVVPSGDRARFVCLRFPAIAGPLDAGYGHLFPSAAIRESGPAEDIDFLYAGTTFTF